MKVTGESFLYDAINVLILYERACTQIHDIISKHGLIESAPFIWMFFRCGDYR